MNYLKKINVLFIRAALTFVYMFGIGIARGLLIMTDWRTKKNDHTFWTYADQKKDATTLISPY